nr:Dihydrofolate reductase [uncultured bacterium]
MIAALGKNRVIGKGNDLLWHIPDDMKRFKALTNGHPVVMGRKTWESLPARFRPLPNRTNIVITRKSDYVAEGAQVVGSIEEALRASSNAPGAEEVFVIGGGEVYALALPFATRLYLTIISDEKDGDIYFPAYEHCFTRVIAREMRESTGLSYQFVTLER